jgi:hypothetical protein
MLIRRLGRLSKVRNEQRHFSLLLNFIIDWEMVFADDERETNATSFKFLQMAHAWKSAQAKKVDSAEDGGSDVASSHGGD